MSCQSSASEGTEAHYWCLRSRLYHLLAAAHSGPLGQELGDVIRVAASSIFEGEPLPDVPSASRAELYSPVYGYAEHPGRDGNLAGSDLPAKLTHLSGSAEKAETRQRACEATYVAEVLLPCLDRVLARAEGLEGAAG